MIIPVTIPARSDVRLPPQLAKLGTDEVLLIELQGSLVADASHRDGQFVGKLHFHEKTPTLLVGYHMLEGSVVALAKPLAVLHRAGEGWDVMALVKRKIIFSKRPMPIVGGTHE